MFQSYKRPNGRFGVQNTRTLDTVDGVDFETEAEAQVAADDMSSKWANRKQLLDAREATRRAEREKNQSSLPLDSLTSRGDGWEGNG